jgi:hypothetical protein
MERNSLKHLFTGEPTYWPSDRNKLNDLVDFGVTKGIPHDFTVEKSCFDLSSDHSPILITLTSHALNHEKQPGLNNRHADLDDFRHLINQRLTLNVSLRPKSKKKDSVEVGTDYEHQRAKEYLTQQHRNSNNSSITTKIIASKHSCKVLHQLNPLFHVEGDQENKTCQETFSTTCNITRNLGKE